MQFWTTNTGTSKELGSLPRAALSLLLLSHLTNQSFLGISIHSWLNARIQQIQSYGTYTQYTAHVGESIIIKMWHSHIVTVTVQFNYTRGFHCYIRELLLQCDIKYNYSFNAQKKIYCLQWSQDILMLFAI